MHLKVIVSRPALPPPLSYSSPMLLQSLQDGFPVVLVTRFRGPDSCEFEGVIVATNDPQAYPIGYYGMGFTREAYEPFRGSITLSNEGL